MKNMKGTMFRSFEAGGGVFWSIRLRRTNNKKMVKKILVGIVDKVKKLNKSQYFRYGLIQEIIHLVFNSLLVLSLTWDNPERILIIFLMTYGLSLIFRHIVIHFSVPLTLKINSYYPWNRIAQPILINIGFYSIVVMILFMIFLGIYIIFSVGMKPYEFFIFFGLIEYVCYLMLMPPFNMFILPKIMEKRKLRKTKNLH